MGITASEAEELIAAQRAAEEKRLADLYKANEILAFNIGALALCAFNAPQRFPKSPAEAFKKEASADWRAQKQAFLEIAKQINKRRDNENDG
ncbi:MAG: hypothetical protein ACI4J4_01570 [Ruminiclostridium sp.]